MEQAIIVTYECGRVEYFKKNSIAFAAINCLFGILVDEEMPTIDTEGMECVLAEIDHYEISVLEFVGFRMYEFTRVAGEGRGVAYDVKIKGTRDIPSTVKELISGVTSGEMKLEVLNPEDVPEELREGLEEHISKLMRAADEELQNKNRTPEKTGKANVFNIRDSKTKH